MRILGFPRAIRKLTHSLLGRESHSPCLDDQSRTHQVLAIFQSRKGAERIKALEKLRRRAPVETLDAVLSLLTSADQQVRQAASGSLFLFRDQAAQRAGVLAQHLSQNEDPQVRLKCAVALMSVPGEPVNRAFRQALSDSCDKVVQIACLEVGHRGEPGSTDALLTVLGHQSWRVRLEAVKALIKQRKVDRRVLATLESMSHDPEAARYDAEDDLFTESLQTFKEVLDPKVHRDLSQAERWGKLSSIIAKAREAKAEG